jgi:hypothetical protein
MHSWEGDPRPEPVPEYGTLQPGSGLKQDQSIDPQSGSWRVLFAVAAGIMLAAFFATGNARAAFEEITRFLTLQGKPEPASPAVLSEHELERLDRKSPQQQAEALLERAVNHYEGANDQIAARVEGWWGKLKFTPQFNALITTALNSNDLRVRAAGIELDLAAMGAIKSPATIERLALQAGSGPRPQRVWALWELGLLGNRGVEPARVNEILVSQLHDPDPEVRHWAVEGLAYLGTNETIAPLLQTFHDDSSAMVRERAACSLAQSGMLSRAQRMTAVPRLLDFSNDFSLDEQTRMVLGEDLSVLLSQTGKTIIFVTHSLGEAVFLADRVAVFSARPGTIKEIIPVEEPHPRKPAFMTSEKFTLLRNQLYSLLHDEIRKAVIQSAASERAGVGRGAAP